MTLNPNFYLNDTDIKLFLDFKDFFENFCQMAPKNPINSGVKISGFRRKERKGP